MKVKMPDSRNKVQLHSNGSIILSQNGTELPDCDVICRFFLGGGVVTLPEIDGEVSWRSVLSCFVMHCWLPHPVNTRAEEANEAVSPSTVFYIVSDYDLTPSSHRNIV